MQFIGEREAMILLNLHSSQYHVNEYSTCKSIQMFNGYSIHDTYWPVGEKLPFTRSTFTQRVSISEEVISIVTRDLFTDIDIPQHHNTGCVSTGRHKLYNHIIYNISYQIRQ